MSVAEHHIGRGALNRQPIKIGNAIAAGKEFGMVTFDQRLLELVTEGIITEEAALEKANNAEALSMNLQGIFLGEDNAILG